MRKDNEMKEDNSSPSRGNLISGLYKVLSMIIKYISEAVTKMMKGMINVINSLYMKFLSSLLRSVVATTLVINFFINIAR